MTVDCNPEAVASDFPLFIESPAHLEKLCPAGPRPWFWENLVGPGVLTLLTAQWKTGKTTLVSVLAKMMANGGELGRQQVFPGKVIYLSEESVAHWRDRNAFIQFADNIGWFCRPFVSRPSLAEWTKFIDALNELQEVRPWSLLVIDPLAAFLPGAESNPSAMTDALQPLQRLTNRGAGVLVLHHPSKRDQGRGRQARGTGALPGTVDILLEMRRWPNAESDDRRRLIDVQSRFPESPEKVLLELCESGVEYKALGTPSEVRFEKAWGRLYRVLREAPHKLSRQEIQLRWHTQKRPDANSLRTWLEDAVKLGRVLMDGKGVRGSAYRYWLPEKEIEWRSDPLATFCNEQQEQGPIEELSGETCA